MADQNSPSSASFTFTPDCYYADTANKTPAQQPQNSRQVARNPNGLTYTCRRHHLYRGIRYRGGKWVSEIREPKKPNRIWLGTYETPEMAAAAYDVAVLAIKGKDANLNFPQRRNSYPIPASNSAIDIRIAAAAAGAKEVGSSYKEAQRGSGREIDVGSSGKNWEYLDNDEEFDLPYLMVDMVGDLMVPPTEFNSTQALSASKVTGGDSLWDHM